MQRPTSVTVLGVLNIIFGVLGICGTGFSLLTLYVMPRNPNFPNPALEAIDNNPGYALFLQVSGLLGFIVSILLIAAGIGLLNLRPWGRMISIGYSVYAIVMGLVGLAVNYIFVLAPLMQQMNQLPAGPQRAGAIGGMVGGLVGGVVGMAYPIVLLCFMLSPRVKAAFSRGRGGYGSEERIER